MVRTDLRYSPAIRPLLHGLGDPRSVRGQGAAHGGGGDDRHRSVLADCRFRHGGRLQHFLPAPAGVAYRDRRADFRLRDHFHRRLRFWFAVQKRRRQHRLHAGAGKYFLLPSLVRGLRQLVEQLGTGQLGNLGAGERYAGGTVSHQRLVRPVHRWLCLGSVRYYRGANAEYR